MSHYIDQIKKLTKQYNDAIRALEGSYQLEKSQLGWLSSASGLRQQYSQRYEVLANEYQQKRQQLLHVEEINNPKWAKSRRIWSRILIVSFVLMMGSCMFQISSVDEAEPASQAMATDKTTYWNAENIPIPHLQDASQYVSNPDQVLSQTTVAHMNGTLQRLDSELGIESVVIVVNHIENDDPFRMAQDVGNKYGVGRNDRGLVIVVGYQDHSINISPGRSLEGDLTDVECHRLEQQYVIPAMRAQQPDSALLYLTDAIYAFIQKKALPQMSQLSSQSEKSDDEEAAIFGIYAALCIGWFILLLYKNQQYQWMNLVGASLLANPFVTHVTYHGGGFGGGGGGFGGGGSFGGGSFGGGGATSRW